MTHSFDLFVGLTARNIRFWNVCVHCWYHWFT